MCVPDKELSYLEVKLTRNEILLDDNHTNVTTPEDPR